LEVWVVSKGGLNPRRSKEALKGRGFIRAAMRRNVWEGHGFSRAVMTRNNVWEGHGFSRAVGSQSESGFSR